MKPIHLLSLVPFIAIIGGVFFANKVTPYIFGLPFFLFWYLAWLFATSGIMAIVYVFDPATHKEDEQ